MCVYINRQTHLGFIFAVRRTRVLAHKKNIYQISNLESPDFRPTMQTTSKKISTADMTDDDRKLLLCGAPPMSVFKTSHAMLTGMMQDEKELDEQACRHAITSSVKCLQERFGTRGNPVCLFCCGHVDGDGCVSLCAYCFLPLFIGTQASELVSQEGNVASYRVNWDDADYEHAMEVYCELRAQASEPEDLE